MPGCYSEPCPKCGTSSPCVDHQSVDIGVGFQNWDHEFFCPTHGAFAFADDEASLDDLHVPSRRVAIFQDEVSR